MVLPVLGGKLQVNPWSILTSSNFSRWIPSNHVPSLIQTAFQHINVFQRLPKKICFSLFFAKNHLTLTFGGKPRVQQGWNLLPHRSRFSRAERSADVKSVRSTEDWLTGMLWRNSCWDGFNGPDGSHFAKIILFFFGSTVFVQQGFSCSQENCGGWSWSKQELDSTPGHTLCCLDIWIVVKVIYMLCLVLCDCACQKCINKVRVEWSWIFFKGCFKTDPLNIASYRWVFLDPCLYFTNSIVHKKSQLAIVFSICRYVIVFNGCKWSGWWRCKKW